MSKIKILIADDHQLVTEGLVSLLDGEPGYEVISTVRNGFEAIKKVEILQPDLVLMDIDMPMMDGIQSTEEIKRRLPHVKIIILSMHKEKSLIQRAIKIGADGYQVKNADRREFLKSISEVMAGRKSFSDEVKEALEMEKGAKAHSSFQNASVTAFDLTEREIEILKLIAEGFNNREIGDKLFISQNTVDTHRKNIMRKLSANNVAALIKFAMKAGLMD